MQDLLDAVSTLLSQTDPSGAARIERDTPQHPTRRLLRVLLVEDVAADAVLIQWELKRTRFDIECECVDTKMALIAALERQPWDLIITDHTMPQFNAMAVLRIVRDRGLTVPCMLVSGTASEQTAAAAMKIGADDFVSKNDLKALGPSVTRALDDANTRRARASLSRIRLKNGQEFEVLEWAADAAILTGLVGLRPGYEHDCLFLSGEARRACAFTWPDLKWRRSPLARSCFRRSLTYSGDSHPKRRTSPTSCRPRHRATSRAQRLGGATRRDGGSRRRSGRPSISATAGPHRLVHLSDLCPLNSACKQSHQLYGLVDHTTKSLNIEAGVGFGPTKGRSFSIRT
jgi:CheY-like chemotaxis protein